jgi:arabinose-5-phosphate isomerase
MKSKENQSLKTAIEVLESESDAIRALIKRMDKAFLRALDLAASCKGKIAVTGMGKSGIICKKIAATLSSTGSPAIFLHASEAMHGDVGALDPNDVLLVISKSGESAEILHILNVAKRLCLPLIAFCGNAHSTLAHDADAFVDVSVEEEACAFGLAPTSSTAAALAMGDALAVSLMKRKGFRIEDFASFHPAGALGKKLLRVRELMHRGAEMPKVLPDTPMADVIYEMSRKKLGMTTVTNSRGMLMGVISDGDLRRLLQKSANPMKLVARQCMTPTPKTISEEELATVAIAKMEKLKITSLVAVNIKGRALGVVHIHDLWRTQMF